MGRIIAALFDEKAAATQRRTALRWLYTLAPLPNLLIALLVWGFARLEAPVPGWVGLVFLGLGTAAYWGLMRLKRSINRDQKGYWVRVGLLEAAGLGNFLLLWALALGFGLGVWAVGLFALGVGLYLYGFARAARANV